MTRLGWIAFLLLLPLPLIDVAFAMGSDVKLQDVEAPDAWQTIDLQSPARAASQVELIIQTDGPRMTGLVRLPGAPASNFDTGREKTVVDLMNVGSAAGGYAQISTVEVRFVQAIAGQSFLMAVLRYEE